MDQPTEINEAWYRNPWVWLLIAIPGLTVVGCLFTMYLALTNPHILVSDTVATPSITAGSIDTGAA